ncbi:hypothetical protein V7056_19305 [Bacillus sp. JJ664]
MKTNIYFDASIKKGIYKFVFGFNKVKITSLEHHEKGFIFSYKDESIKLKMYFIGKTAKYLKDILSFDNVDRRLSNGNFSIQKSGNESFSFQLYFEPSLILQHDFSNSSFILTNKGTMNPDTIYLIKLSYSKEQLVSLKNIALGGLTKQTTQKQEVVTKISEVPIEQINSIKKKKKKTKPNPNPPSPSFKRVTTRDLIDSIKKYEEMLKVKEKNNTETNEFNDRILKSKGIYLANPHAFRICNNCVNFNSSKCTVHSLKLSKNHSCRKFYGYKTYLGGAFSPR